MKTTTLKNIAKRSFILGVSALVLLTAISCKKIGLRIKGTGPVVEQTLDLETFTGVDLKNNLIIKIIKGEKNNLLL